jgi:signal transduction histidine kinase
MSFWARQSIAVKLPVAFALVLLVLGTAMGVVSYLEVRQTVVGIATSRLMQAAGRLAAVLGDSAAQRTAAMQRLIELDAVARFLREPEASASDAVTAAARAYLGPAAAFACLEVLDAAGRPVHTTGAAFPPAPAGLLDDLQSPRAAIGRLHDLDGALVYTVGGRVAADGQTLGYVVERRRIGRQTPTTQTINLLASFIGGVATVLIGNRDGSYWSDLSQPLAGLPITTDGPARSWAYERPGAGAVLAWAEPIPDTPWMVAVEFPRSDILAPAHRLVRRAWAIAITLLLLAAAAGWWYSRQITTPLRAVTDAAQAMAESGHAPHIASGRADEIGRLADAFNTMAERVEHARADLEARVAARTAELSAVNRELESFSYSVSHDLRAPLRAIAGFVQILEEDHAGAFAPEARRALARVRVNATRMGRLIDDLLMFARIGRQPMAPQLVDLTQLARTVADEALATATHPITLVVEPMPPCHGEPALLEQVYANLIANAIKFTARAEGATITIGAQGGDETVYFVRDNGAGFDARFAEKLFGVFQRLHGTAEFEGTGVGLAIVQRIVTRHGGRVWAEGRVHEGATFYFTLRPADGKQATVPPR